MPEEPIVPVIRRPETKRHPSEDELDRERRIAREVREGRERFERKSEDRDAAESRRNKSKPPSDTVVTPRKLSAEQKSDENRKVSSESRKTSREEPRSVSRDDNRKVSSRDDRERKITREEKVNVAPRPVPDILNSSKPKQTPTKTAPQVKILATSLELCTLTVYIVHEG